MAIILAKITDKNNVSYAVNLNMLVYISVNSGDEYALHFAQTDGTNDLVVLMDKPEYIAWMRAVQLNPITL